MCDPATLAIVSAASTAVGAAGSIASSMGQAKAQKKQQREVQAWQQQQKQSRQAEGVRQEDLRQKADAERMQGVEQLGADAQQKRQAEEEARLANYLQGGEQQQTPELGVPVSVADAELSGQKQGDAGEFRSDLAKKINEATTGARQRMAALARVSSFGDSFGGLGTGNREILGESGREIDKFNQFRHGSMGAYGAEKAIDPVQVTYTPSPLADAFSTALQVGAQGLGNAWGGRTGVFPAAPKAPSPIGPIVPGKNASLGVMLPPILPGNTAPAYRPTFNGRIF